MKTARPSFATNGHTPASAPILAGDLPADCVRRLERSLRKQWKKYGRRLERCQKDPSEEAIHNFRVEARQLLSTLELLDGLVPAKAALKTHRALKDHLEIFAGLRDVHVQLPVVKRLRKSFAAARPFSAYLRRRLKRATASAHKAVRKARTDRLDELIELAAAAVRARRGHYGGRRGAGLLLRSTTRAFARVVELQTQIDPAAPETIHRTRVAFKKFRYMAETLAGFMPTGNQAVVDGMHRYQTSLGEVQDADVLSQGFERFLAKHPIEPPLAGDFAKELSRRRQQLIEACLRETGQLFEFWPRPALSAPRSTAISRVRGSPNARRGF